MVWVVVDDGGVRSGEVLEARAGGVIGDAGDCGVEGVAEEEEDAAAGDAPAGWWCRPPFAFGSGGSRPVAAGAFDARLCVVVVVVLVLVLVLLLASCGCCSWRHGIG